MESYYPLIAGKQGEVRSWIYHIRASYFIEHPIAAMRLKKELERTQPEHVDHEHVIGRVGMSTPEQEYEAVCAAKTAQKIWRKRPLSHRKHLVTKTAEFCLEHSNAIRDILIAEGHPYTVSQWQVDAFRAMGTDIATSKYVDMMKQVSYSGGRTLTLVRKPDGVVCMSPPRNASLSAIILAGKSIFAGNAVIVKAPRSIPLAAAWFVHNCFIPILEELEAPPGILSLVCGPPQAILEGWLQHPDVNDILYFGDSKRGMDFGNRAYLAGKKAILELSGNDTLLVWKDAELELAAKTAAESFYASTQLCIVPKNVIVHPGVAKEFLHLLAREARALKPALPEEPSSTLAPVYKSIEFSTMLSEALHSGAQLIHGGKRIDLHGKESPTGLFLEPTVISIDGIAKAKNIRAFTEETFFPLLPVIIDDHTDDEQILDSMLEFIESNKYGLRNSLWCQEESVIQRFAEETSTGGMLKINDSHLNLIPGLPPHGGTGISGGIFGESNFTFLSTTHLQAISDATAVLPRSKVFSQDPVLMESSA